MRSLALLDLRRERLADCGRQRLLLRRIVILGAVATAAGFWLVTTLALAGCHSREAVTCIAEGQTLMGGMSLSCCAGLTTASCQTEGPGSGSGSVACGEPLFDCAICVRECGDGECTTGENRCNCPDDCTGSGHDAGPNCHEDGEPFDPPSELRDRIVIPPEAAEQLCCTYSASLVWVRSGPTCDLSSGQMECLGSCGDFVCDEDEAPCTCPHDCATATEGCLSAGMGYEGGSLFPTPACCPGLQAVRVVALITESEHYGECAPLNCECYVCLGECGNGVCDDGEDRCLCPADCP
jgi:hypothetical protein